MQDLSSSASSALADLLDRASITEVVQDWGMARDEGRWDRLRACYTTDAVMHTTWFVGSAAEFVERSIKAAAGGAHVQHFIGAATIALAGDKAVSESRMMLMVRGKLDDVEVDITCWGRFHDRFVKRDGLWRIIKRVPVYEKDRLDPVDPAARVTLDADVLSAYPAGCRHLVYLQSRNGAVIATDLAARGTAALARLEAESAAWLGQREGPFDLALLQASAGEMNAVTTRYADAGAAPFPGAAAAQRVQGEAQK